MALVWKAKYIIGMTIVYVQPYQYFVSCRLASHCVIYSTEIHSYITSVLLFSYGSQNEEAVV